MSTDGGNTTPGSQDDALQVLQAFLSALMHTRLEEAYAYLSRAQQEESPFHEFIEGYQAGTISINGFGFEGIREPDPMKDMWDKDAAPFLVPEGFVAMQTIQNDGMPPSGRIYAMNVPLRYLYIVWEDSAWRIQSCGAGPLHTTPFFERPTMIPADPWWFAAPGLMHYEDEARQYQIMVPGRWRDHSGHPAAGVATSLASTRSVGLLAPSGAGLLPNVTIQTYDVSDRPNVQSAMDYARLARASQQGIELRAPVPFSYDCWDGVRWEYKYGFSSMAVHSVTDYYLDGRTMILVAAVSKPEQFEQDKEETIPLLDSFRFVRKAVYANARPF